MNNMCTMRREWELEPKGGLWHLLLLVWLKSQNLHNHAKFPVQTETYFIGGAAFIIVYRWHGAALHCGTMTETVAGMVLVSAVVCAAVKWCGILQFMHRQRCIVQQRLFLRFQTLRSAYGHRLHLYVVGGVGLQFLNLELMRLQDNLIASVEIR